MERGSQGFCCGIDEAGRGPIAGPVCAAAVILCDGFDLSILKDSKKLSPSVRDKTAALLRSSESQIGVGWAWPEEIDILNIHHASLLAMSRAFHSLYSSGLKAGELSDFSSIEKVLVDGKFVPLLPVPATALVKGDTYIPEISAASIIAKVVRDKWMTRYSWIEPEWEFDRHKGYPTPRHRELCRKYGLSPIHRKSFRIY